VNATTKGTQLRKIGKGTATDDKGAGGTVSVGHKVVKGYVMIKRIRPEVGAEIGAGEHRTKGIANGLMGTFAGTILMGRIWPGQLYLVSEIVEGFVNLTAFAELTATIHPYIFVGARRGVTHQSLIQPINWGCFGSEGTTE
jgi:hypothetical protein